MEGGVHGISNHFTFQILYLRCLIFRRSVGRHHQTDEEVACAER